MIDTTLLYSIGATLYAIGISIFAFLSKRITPEEVGSILDAIYEAKQEHSDGGSEITADEVIEIVEKFVKALKE